MHIKEIAVALSLALLGGLASAQTLSQSAVLGSVVEHPTVGCGGAVVQTPPPGKQFSASAAGMPAGAAAFYAEAAARHVTWATSMECTHTGLTHVLVPASADMQNAGINNGYVSLNWSGYQISNRAQYTQAGWTIPAVVPPNPPYATNYYSSTWSGVGGGVNAGSGPLIQAGTAQHLVNHIPQYYFWYEIVGGATDTHQEIRVTTKMAKPGDVAATVVIWTPDTNNPQVGTVTFGICNFSGDGCTNIAIKPPNVPFTPLPGNTTEWIVEAPSINGVVAPLADFDHVNFVNACWTANYTPNATCSTIKQGMPGSLSLSRYVFGSNQILAAPDVTTLGTGFTDIYLQPQKNPDPCPTCSPTK